MSQQQPVSQLLTQAVQNLVKSNPKTQVLKKGAKVPEIRVKEKRIPTLIELQVKLKIKNIVKKKKKIELSVKNENNNEKKCKPKKRQEEENIKQSKRPKRIY